MQQTFTSDFGYFEKALADCEKTFVALEKEIKAFKPLPIGAFEGERAALLAQIRRNDPRGDLTAQKKFVNSQIQASASATFQFNNAFGDRFNIAIVLIVLLSHALCESLVNAVLALRLAEHKAPDLFALIERANVKEKWTVGLKSVHPQYELPKDGQLYETLHFLCSQRNALVHYKIELTVGGEKVFDGSALKRLSIKEGRRWAHRFLVLPYDLLVHASKQLPKGGFPLIALLPLSYEKYFRERRAGKR